MSTQTWSIATFVASLFQSAYACTLARASAGQPRDEEEEEEEEGEEEEEEEERREEVEQAILPGPIQAIPLTCRYTLHMPAKKQTKTAHPENQQK